MSGRSKHEAPRSVKSSVLFMLATTITLWLTVSSRRGGPSEDLLTKGT
jgi:hypothetical protein